jgi:hypothetical protein
MNELRAVYLPLCTDIIAPPCTALLFLNLEFVIYNIVYFSA